MGATGGPDAGKFPKSVLGNKDGHWAGERWLDIRQTSILRTDHGRAFQLCKKKGFDGIDPDNIDGYQSKTGFPLTASEQLTYNTWVATEAHDLGLTVDQKNDNDQIKDLVNVLRLRRRRAVLRAGLVQTAHRLHE